MRVRNSLTGKYESMRLGGAVCGKRFSEITITANDIVGALDSQISRERTMEWLEHLLTVRLDRPAATYKIKEQK